MSLRSLFDLFFPRSPVRPSVEPCAFRSRQWFAPTQVRYALDQKGERCAPMRRVRDQHGQVSYRPYGPVRATYVGDRSKYKPRQGAKECARRLEQKAKGMIT